MATINPLPNAYYKKVLPAAYDDSLSYYELSCKLYDKTNELVEQTNENTEIVETINAEWPSIKGDAQTATAAADAAAASANAASDRANQTADIYSSQLTALDARVSNIVADGQVTEGNTELIDIRIGYDGILYSTAGDAVRGQTRYRMHGIPAHSLNLKGVDYSNFEGLEIRNGKLINGYDTSLFIPIESSNSSTLVIDFKNPADSTYTWPIPDGGGTNCCILYTPGVKALNITKNNAVYVSDGALTANLKAFSDYERIALVFDVNQDIYFNRADDYKFFEEDQTQFAPFEARVSDYPGLKPIKAMSLYVDDPSHDYVFNELDRKRDFGGNVVTSISLWDNTDNVQVNLINIVSSAITEKSFYSLRQNLGKSSSIAPESWVAVDWESIEPGSGYYYRDFNIKVNPLCIKQKETKYQSLFNGIEKYSTAFCAIKNMHIATPTPEKAYYPISIVRQDYTGGESKATALTIADEDGTMYNLLNVYSQNYTEKAFNTFSVGNISGWFVIDWDSIDVGTNTSVNLSNVKTDHCFLNRTCVVPTQAYSFNDLFVPAKMYVVLGRDLYLYKWNMLKNMGDGNLIVTENLSAADLKDEGDKFHYKPANIGSLNLVMTMFKDGIAEKVKTMNYQVVGDNSTAALNALFIGDSLTEGAIYIAELMNMLPNMTTVGTRSGYQVDADGNGHTVSHEGRSAWSAYDYVSKSDADNGVVNAFWNPSTNSFDFSYYMNTYGADYGTLTDVFVMLGTNDSGSEAGNARCINSLQTMVTSIASYSSTIKIHLILPPPPIKSEYAWGQRNHYNLLSFKNSMFDLWNLIKDTFGDYDVIPAGLNVDCWYDFPRTEVAVNSRNPETVEVGNENVHPNKYGYYKIADVVYAHILGTR